MSDADRFRLAAELFHAARQVEPDQREAFLDERCEGDEDLRRDVLSLLAEDAADPRLLERPVLGPQVLRHHLEPPPERAPHEPPDSIGDYRIIRVIGEGGMGVVYEAEQESPRRQVALKVIHAGVASPNLLRRFEHEAEVLGRLQHPGIAQIFEAGTFGEGAGTQPFFAMEYVRGETLDTYIESNKLDTRGILGIMAKICDAVEHAHQRGVIHRDLKPGNILVDHSGQPKILDFGVARATDSDLQATTIRTSAGQLVGTVPYMSPEQAAGDRGEVDTRSDVYALGVVAYEMLAGRLPYNVREKMVHEAVRVIREIDPTPLSSISRVFAGDVWTIVRKALEKDKSRRYQSASELAADIHRFLQDEPIAARPPSVVYQLRKLARRHKAVAAGAALAILALVAGTGLASRQAVKATRAQRVAEGEKTRAEEQLAQTEAAREEAEAVLEVLSRTLASASPSALGRDVLVTDILDNASATVSRNWSDRPLVEARLRNTIGITYMTLGEHETAEEHLERALELRLDELGAEHLDTVRTMVDLAKLRGRQGHNAVAVPFIEQAYAVRRRTLGERHRETMGSMRHLGILYTRLARYDDAERVLRRALELYKEVLGEDHSYTGSTMASVARLYHGQGRANEAEQHFIRALEIRRAALGEDHTHVVSIESGLGRLYVDEGRYDEAEALLDHILETRRKLLGETHPYTLATSFDVARLYAETGRRDRAEPLLEQTLASQRRVLRVDHPDILRSIDALADCYVRQRRYDEAVTLTSEAIAGAARSFPEGHPASGRFLVTHGRVLTGLRRYDEALETLSRAHDVLRPEPDAPRALADLYDAWGKPEQAAVWRTKVRVTPESDTVPSSG